jgi:hypothetical protein
MNSFLVVFFDWIIPTFYVQLYDITLLKVMSVLRALEYTPNEDVHVFNLQNMFTAVGQMAHDFPSVFSFFLPEYVPPGRLAASSLVSPESQLLDAPKIVNIMNGLFSLLKFGLASCFGGFGEWTFVKDGTCEYDGDFVHGAARPQVKPSTNQSSVAVVADLSTLLTAGRLSPANREIVRLAYDGVRQTLPEWINGPRNENAVTNCLSGAKDAFGTREQAMAWCAANPKCQWLHDTNCDGLYWRPCSAGVAKMVVGDMKACTKVRPATASADVLALAKQTREAEALALAQQLMVTTAEFHTTNVVRASGAERQRRDPTPNLNKDYKAVVYLLLGGGCDSFNMLTPHTCTQGPTVRLTPNPNPNPNP